MRIDINTWKSMACFYGHLLSLRDERILGVRQSKDLYELYYRNEQEKIRLLYIEKDAFLTIYNAMHQNEWEEIFVTKLIHHSRQTPIFLLKGSKNGYAVQYYFEIREKIIIDIEVIHEGNPLSPFEELTSNMREDLKRLHHMVASYAVTRYKTNIVLSNKLNNFIERLNLPYLSVTTEESKNSAAIKKTITEHFQHCIKTMKKSPEYGVNSVLAIYKKKFDSSVAKVIVWFTLLELVDEHATENKENKEPLLKWLIEQYRTAKKELTEMEIAELSHIGINLI